MPTISKKEQTTGQRETRTKRVPVPELSDGLEMIVRSLSRSERAKFEAAMLNKEGDPIPHMVRQQDERMVVLCAVDEQGNQLYCGDDIQELSKVDAAWLGRVADAARQLSGMDAARGKRVEDLAGN